MTELIELFREPVEFSVEETVDEKTGKSTKQFVVEAVVQHADVPNRNNRIYPRSLLDREIKRFQQAIDEKVAFGEADHPKGQGSSITRVSALFRKVWMEKDGRVKAQAVIPNTQVGKDVQAIIEAGGRPGWSSRGNGSVRSETRDGNTYEVVQEDYRLGTFDCVVNQSVPSAVTTTHRLEQEELSMTLESLKKDHPEVYEALLAEAKKSFDESFEAKFLARLEQEKATIEEQIRADVEENIKTELPSVISEALKQPESLLLTIAHILAENGYAPEGALLSDDEGNEEIKKLESKVDDLTTKLAEAQKAITESRKTENKTLVTARIAEMTKDIPYGKQIASALSECESVEAVEAAFPKAKEMVEKIVTETRPDPEKLAGKGQIPEATDNGTGGADETLIEKNRQRRAAGLAPLNG